MIPRKLKIAIFQGITHNLEKKIWLLLAVNKGHHALGHIIIASFSNNAAKHTFFLAKPAGNKSFREVTQIDKI